MTTDTFIYIALAAVLVFWAVGAHNRLVRLKNAVGKDYPQIDVQLRQRQDFIAQLLQSGEHFDAELVTQLTTASRAVQSAMEQVRQRPWGESEARTLQQAEQQLDQKLAALWLSPRTQELAKGDAVLRQVVLDLVHLEARLELVAEPYNRAVATFNEAAHEFPAWLIAQLAGLKPLPGLHLGQHGAAREAARPMMVGRRESDQPPATSDL